MMALMPGLKALREQGQMTWSPQADGWNGTPEEIFLALGADGFQECKNEMTRSRRDCRPVGSVRQGINPQTTSVATLIWMSRLAAQPAMLFLEIDGETVASHQD